MSLGVRVLTITMLEHRQKQENCNDAWHIRLSPVFIPTYVSLLMARQYSWPSSGASGPKVVMISPKHTTEFYTSLLSQNPFPTYFNLIILRFECWTKHHLFQETCLTIPGHSCPRLGKVHSLRPPKSLCISLSLSYFM